MSVPAIRFRKMNGLGNEILVVDLRAESARLTPQAARDIAAGERTGFDQMMVLLPPRAHGLDAFVRIYNTDGSLSAACGNGTRCIAAVVMEETGNTDATFETDAGLLPAWDAGGGLITVDMGPPAFDWDRIPLAEEIQDTRILPVQIGPIDDPVLHSPSAVSMGNPHAIFWVDDVATFDLEKIGPMLEHHPLFPERANISLAEITAPDAITLRVWERGAGITRACGSGACAAAVAAARLRRTGRSVTVTLPGGPLRIDWRERDDHVLMTGPWELEYEGELPADLVLPAA